MRRLGSVAWWLRHELRLAGRELVLDFGPAAIFVASNFLLLAYAGAHVAAWLVLVNWHGFGPGMPLSTIMLVALVTGCGVQGIRGGYRALFGRGDGELLAASMHSIRKVLWARLIAISLTSVALPLFWLSAFANVGLLLGHPNALALYPATLAIGFATSSLAVAAMLVTLRLVGHEGLRLVTRFALAVVLVALILSNILAKNLHALQPAFDKALGWLNWTGQALDGAIAPFCAVLAVGLGLLLVMPFFLEKAFEASLRRPAPRAIGKLRTQPGPLHDSGTYRLVLKEWRLLGRDGKLLSQIFLSLALASGALVLMLSKGGVALPLILGSVVVYAAGNLSSDLSWLALSAEASPWLIATAPRPARALAAKLLAAALPVAIMLAAAAIALCSYDVSVAVQVIVFGLLSCACVSTLNSTFATPGSQADVLFGRRQKNRLLAFGDVAVCLAFCAAISVPSMLFKVTATVLPVVLVASVAVLRKPGYRTEAAT
jgi:ABC-2 type transport system permease protein